MKIVKIINPIIAITQPSQVIAHISRRRIRLIFLGIFRSFAKFISIKSYILWSGRMPNPQSNSLFVERASSPLLTGGGTPNPYSPQSNSLFVERASSPLLTLVQDLSSTQPTEILTIVIQPNTILRASRRFLTKISTYFSVL
jgi:hypothetical protein